MIISCSQCGTTYTLDDNLIPAGGASVQCTRCGSVFTARKGGDAAAAKAPPPAPSRPKAPAPREGSKTMIFGGDTGPRPPEQPATNKTMIFGGDAGPKPAAPPANPGSRTMIFGGAPPVAADAPRPAPANPGSRTMIFGGTPPVSAPEDKPAQNPANKTMIFGGDSKPAGKPAAGPAANPGSRTMIFGGAPVLTPDEKKKPEPKPPAPSGPRPEPQNPANKTMIFGGSPPPPEPKSKPRAGSQTMMFGAAPPLTSQTLQFGPPGQAPVTDDSGQVVFGADAARDKPSVLTEGTVRIDQADLDRMRREHESGAVTPTGGTGALMDDDAPANPQKTQLFGAGLGPEVPDEAPQPKPPAKHDKTQLFAGNGGKSEKPPEPAKHQKTQLFAMGSKPPIPEPPGPSSNNEFEDFAAAIKAEDDGPRRGARNESTDPALNKVDDTPSSVQVDASIVDTLEPDKVAPLPPHEKPIRAGRRVTIDAPMLSPPDLLATTLPNRDALPQPSAGLELPPEVEAPQMFASEPVQDSNPADEAAALKADLGRKNKIAALIIILVAVLMALGIAWAVVGKTLYGKLTGTEVPIEALASTERVLAQLRSDDAASRTAAVATLRGLIAKYPRMLEAHAALVTALALEVDEAQDRARRYSASIVGFGVRIKSLDTRSSDYERDRDVLTAAQKKLEPLVKPQAAAVDQAHAALQAAMAELNSAVKAEPNPTAQASQAVGRASALFHAARGDALAVEQVQAWTRAGGQPEHDVWPQLAVPMFALNQKPQVQGSVIEAQATLKEITGREYDLARAFVLLARARLDLNDLEGADEALDKLLGLRPEHTFAQELKRRVGESRLEANALKPKEVAPPAPAPAVPGPQ